MGMVPKDGGEDMVSEKSSKKHQRGEYIEMKSEQMIQYVKSIKNEILNQKINLHQDSHQI